MFLIHFPQTGFFQNVGPFASLQSAHMWLEENGRQYEDLEILEMADPAQAMYGLARFRGE